MSNLIRNLVYATQVTSTALRLTVSSGIRPGGAMKRNKKLWMMGTENKRTEEGICCLAIITTKSRKRKKEGAIIARSDFRSGSSNGTRRRNTTLSAHQSPVYPPFILSIPAPSYDNEGKSWNESSKMGVINQSYSWLC